MRSKIESKNIPCWYGVSFRDNPLGIVIEMHKSIINLAEDEQRIVSLQKEFGFQHFSEMNGNNEFFGFEDVGIKNDSGEFVEIFFPIPIVDTITDEPCEWCSGTGGDGFFKGSCPACEGTKKKIFHDSKLINAISASLFVLFQRRQMCFPKKQTSSKINQLMVFNVMCFNRMQGFGIGGVFSVELCNYFRWLAKHDERARSVIGEAEKAMQMVFHRCCYRRSMDLYDDDFWIDLESDGRLVINSFGQCCQLHYVEEVLPGRGCKFSCHNVDNAIQQIEFFAALGVLHDRAREDMGQY